MFSIDVSDCEFDWFLGQAGVLNETSNSCECTDGFSGRDEWTSSNTCRVNENLSFIMQSISTTVSFLAIIVLICAIYGNLKLQKGSNSKLGGDQQPSASSFQMSTSQISSHQPTLSIRNNTSSYFVKEKRNQQKKKRATFFRNMLFVLLFWLISACFYFVHGLLFILADEKVVLGEPKNKIHRFTLFFGASFVLIGACHLLTTWFNSLPSIEKFGKLLKYNTILIRFPNFVPYGGRFLTFLAFVGPLLVYVIIPEIFGDMELATELIVWFFLFFCVIVEVFMLITFHNLVKIYSNALSLAEMNNGFNDTETRGRTLKRVLKSLKQMRLIISNITIGGAVLLVLWKSLNFTYQYLFAPFFAISLTAHTVLVAIVNIRSMK